MGDCITCGSNALYKCKPCKAMFCKEHKAIHEMNKKQAHIFEIIKLRLDSSQSARIVENLTLKINKVKEHQERILLETERLIRKIEELCTNSLKHTEDKLNYYTHLLELSQNALEPEDLSILESQLGLVLSFNVSTLNFKEVQDFYSCHILEEPIHPAWQRLEQLRHLPVDDAKQLLEQEFSLFLQSHTDGINSIAITTDQQYIITGSSDTTIRIWDYKTKRQKYILRGHRGAVLGLVVTSDSKYIVSASADNTLRIWNYLEKAQVAILRGHKDIVRCVVITHDNKYIVSGSDDKSVRLWNYPSQKIDAVLKGHTLRVTGLAITSDNRSIVSVSYDCSIRIWSIKEKSIDSVMGPFEFFINGLAFTSDSAYIILCSDHNTVGISRFDHKKMKIEWLEGHTSAVTSVAVSSDNLYIVSGSCDKTIRIWNLTEKRIEAILHGHTNLINYVTMTRDSKYIISCSVDRTVRIWNFNEKRLEDILPGHEESIQRIVITYDYRYVFSASVDKKIRVWDLNERTHVELLPDSNSANKWIAKYNEVNLFFI